MEKKMPTAADNILHEVYRILDIAPGDYNLIWKNIELIVDELAKINEQNTINVKTTGTITERLCESILKATVPDTYATLPRHWKWVGDFYIEGIPFNLIISVKSFQTLPYTVTRTYWKGVIICGILTSIFSYSLEKHLNNCLPTILMLPSICDP